MLSPNTVLSVEWFGGLTAAIPRRHISPRWPPLVTNVVASRRQRFAWRWIPFALWKLRSYGHLKLSSVSCLMNLIVRYIKSLTSQLPRWGFNRGIDILRFTLHRCLGYRCDLFRPHLGRAPVERLFIVTFNRFTLLSESCDAELRNLNIAIPLLIKFFDTMILCQFMLYWTISWDMQSILLTTCLTK